MKFMKSCCCSCCTVETGTKILSILGAITFTFQLFGTISSCMSHEDDELEKVIPVQKLGLKVYEFVVAHAVFSAIGVIVCITCAVGAFQRRRNLLIPYLVFQGIILFELAIAVILLCVLAGILGSYEDQGEIRDREHFLVYKTIVISVLGSSAVGLLISLFLAIYYFIVVLSYYKELDASERNPQPSVAYSSVPVNAPPGYPSQTYSQGGAPPGQGPQGGFYPPLPEYKGDVV